VNRHVEKLGKINIDHDAQCQGKTLSDQNRGLMQLAASSLKFARLLFGGYPWRIDRTDLTEKRDEDVL
jgi:hypothetical protein